MAICDALSFGHEGRQGSAAAASDDELTTADQPPTRSTFCLLGARENLLSRTRRGALPPQSWRQPGLLAVVSPGPLSAESGDHRTAPSAGHLVPLLAEADRYDDEWRQ